MTSEVETLKTNEFLRRRKLRIQQVREQSKDIAKKIRLRASAERIRSLVDLDSEKGKYYLEQQNKFVQKLQHLYAKSLDNVGAGHKKAAEVSSLEDANDKIKRPNLTKQRARAAAAELRREKQEKLDNRKKSLDRKLIAREIANEISRDKSGVVSNKFSKVSSVKPSEEVVQAEKPNTIPQQSSITALNNAKDKVTNEMATQCDSEALPNEWEPHIPVLSLPKDDSTKECSPKDTESKSERTKRPNLFALSDEMPSSLRGGLASVAEETAKVNPSLTLVSDYIQNRDLRLREPDIVPKKLNEDLQNIKRTILRSRASAAAGTLYDPVCHVADVQVIPVPSWQAEPSCGFCTRNHSVNKHLKSMESHQFKTITNSQINRIFSSIRPLQHDIVPSPVLRGSSPFKRSKVCPGTFSTKSSNFEKSSKISQQIPQDKIINRKGLVTTYNHSTRDLKDVHCEKRNLVIRDSQTEDDAYSQAMKESSNDTMSMEREHQKKLQEMRHKIAMTKQNVDKEYKDTMAFLKSLPKDMSKPIKNAYKNNHQQQMQKECRQRRMQNDFKKIQKEMQKHSYDKSSKVSTSMKKSPVTVESDDEFNSRDIQYSWMPVPESDGNLAIHTIPTTLRQQKSGNNVKFSKIDSYHEYRSRHKHTPPTKDTAQDKLRENFTSKLSDDTDSSSTSDTSSVENLRLHKSKRKSKSHIQDGKLSDAERIIVYKILDTKAEKKAKCSKNSKAIQEIAKSLSLMSKEGMPRHNRQEDDDDELPMGSKKSSKYADTRVSFEQLKEGIYKTTSDKRDNLASAFFTHRTIEQEKTRDELRYVTNSSGQNTSVRKRDDDGEINKVNEGRQPSASTSTSSFKTAANDKATSLTENDLKLANEVTGTPNNKFIQFANKGGQESGKLYIGATGLLKDDAYEVVIQLRRKDGTQVDSNELNNNVEDKATNVETTSGLQEPIHESKTSEKLSQENDRHVQTPLLHDYPRTEFVKENQNSNNVDENIIKNTDFTDVLPKTTRTEINSKGIGTFNQDYAIPSAFSKGISDMKSANSVSTQTVTPVSPQRPTYSHMSSSTSTAYLSPPEFILPPFLRNNRRMDSISDEISDIIKNKGCCEHCKNCVHGRCGRNRNCSPCKVKVSSYGKCTVPPNTARSATTSEYNAPELYKTCRKKLTSVNLFPKTNKRCTKYEREHKRCLSQHKTSRTRNNVKHKNLPQQYYSSKYKYHEFRINPLLKCYVDKLLKLNKQSLTAIDVANQECSSVSTPGSSIIDHSHNIDNNKLRVQPKISLEQIKENVTQQLLQQYIRNYNDFENSCNVKETENRMSKKTVSRIYRKKHLHKVKSLNISRKLVPSNSKENEKPTKSQSLSQGSSTSSKTDDYIKSMPSVPTKTKSRSKSFPSPRRNVNDKLPHKNHSSDILYSKNSDGSDKITGIKLKHPQTRDKSLATHSARDCVNAPEKQQQMSTLSPLTTSTQTSQQVIDEEISYIKLTESKLQNMEKIADLTEKCTLRLSNLAKVLDQVRRNKTSPYGQVSDTTSVSDTERASVKNSETQLASSITYEPIIEIREKSIPLPQIDTLASPLSDSHHQATETKPTEFEPFLKDIPKPKKNRSLASPEKCIDLTLSPVHLNSAAESYTPKTRSKPPPAMSHKCFKRVPEMMVPHELSTVIEVDSPLSAKIKGPSVRDQSKTKLEQLKLSITVEEDVDVAEENNKCEETKNNPDLVQSNANLSRRQKISSTDSSDETKTQMLDLNKFNEIMLKPFISIQEYAKQCKKENIEEPSNMDNVTKGDANEEMSSLHSDGSLPDVIAELLKRNVIKEPFKFDTASVNSTTASSESTFSVALSNSNEKKKSREIIPNKENIAETSDSMSISSNPDLENAFKKMGMGWASSTLKRTKERLALSSSSNTSSSSLSQYKNKPVHNQDCPELVADSLSTSNAPAALDVEQQTSMINSMTVKQFLTKELSKKITFSNKSRRDDTENEYLSLYETKMPDDMKHVSKSRVEDRSIDSNNRARTSTPVQIFKSMTYHSSSSSNVSNGLFSNADDLSSVKGTSNSIRNHSTSDKDDLTIPNISLRIRKGLSDNSKSS